jgi:histidinol-phosphate phosphatase family protein
MKLFPDKSWTLFLDRDGVINQKVINDYVLQADQFLWMPGVQQTIAYLSHVFGRVLVVTNQQGIGRNLMSEHDLAVIHQKLLQGVQQAGGSINAIYHCPAIKEAESFFRKPLPGMALQARKDYPDIDFKKSVMVGDNISDMIFGKNLKMVTVIIHTDKKLLSDNHKLIDFAFADLSDFAQYLKTILESGK